MKKLLTVLCTFLLALSIASFGPVKAQAETCPFNDVRGTRYENAVTYLYCNGITEGTSATMFSPYRSVTRAEFVTFLYKMAGSPEPYNTSNPFRDVYTSDYYYKAVLWAVEKGVTKGRDTYVFAPKEPVTYQEVFAFIHYFSINVVRRESANKSKYRLNDPSNFDKYSSWAKAHVHWAYYNGIVKGVVQYDLFTPKNHATRGEVAMFLYNYYRSFQNRYLLTVDSKLGSDDNGNTIEHIFNALNDTMTFALKYRKSFVADYNDLANWIDRSFQYSTCIDMCYLFLHAHGGNGLSIYKNNNDTLKPNELYDLLRGYNGHFIVMIESCFSGIFVEYFKSRGRDRFDILTATGKIETARTSTDGGIATLAWSDYIYSSVQSQTFVSLNEVWSNTKDAINSIQIQNPSIYAKRKTYIAFTKAFN